MGLFAAYPSLQDRGVLVTGGATGIGAALVAQFAAQGARVAFVDIDEESAAQLVRQFAGTPHVPVFERVDITDLASFEQVVRRLPQRIGPIRVLLNNAANDVRHQLEETTPERWDSGIAVNLRHQFFAAQYVAEGMKAQGGSIVNFGSVSWMLKQKGLPVYETAKAAVHGLTRSLARELGPWAIRVNTLVPGWTMTEKQLRLWVTEASRAEIAKGQCIDRPLTPEDVARMALFLAADDSAMCTGQDFIVDGGWV